MTASAATPLSTAAPSSAESAESWTEANQRYLLAELARLRERLGSKNESRAEEAVRDARDSMAHPPAIEQLSELFGLNSFERDILLLCAGIEMDSPLAALCSEALGRASSRATFGLAMSALSDPHWNALTPARPLRRFRFIELEAGGLTTAGLRIDERILHYIAGVNRLDPRLEPLLQAVPRAAWIAEEHRRIGEQITALFETDSAPRLLHLCGDDASGQEDVAAFVAEQTWRNLYTMKAEDLPAPGAELDQFILLWARESLLLRAALLLQCGSTQLTPGARHVIARIPGSLCLASRDNLRLEQSCLRFEVNKPEPAGQKRLWERALGPAASTLNGELDHLSEQFRLSARTIFSTSDLVKAGKAPAESGQLWGACRSLSRPRLDDLAQRIVPSAAWDDLILPLAQKQLLLQLKAQVRNRLQVYETWGFSAKGRRGLGVSALFAGESGTGKTLAAEVLAQDLNLDLYRIDLSAVVSKYIGETEKNLRQVFDAAEEGGVMLLFDEADALFGKRGEVKDSHDRYANIEVGYLLQRMEAYQGLAILTTNMRTSLDHSFQRRLRFTVNFPFPDAAHRKAIWSRAFPQGSPTQDLKPERLAQLNVAGGNIRNIALNAAFLAADAKQAIGMEHLLQAARLEAQKIERPLSDAEIRGWV
jgi:hypothetical protein